MQTDDILAPARDAIPDASMPNEHISDMIILTNTFWPPGILSSLSKTSRSAYTFPR